MRLFIFSVVLRAYPAYPLWQGVFAKGRLLLFSRVVRRLVRILSARTVLLNFPYQGGISISFLLPAKVPV